MDGNWINCDEPFELFSSYTCNLSQQINNESYRIVNVSNDTTVHDNWGSCVEDICGCTDYYASNYNPSATFSSNDCEYCFGQTNILLHQNNTFANCDGALIIDHNDTSIFHQLAYITIGQMELTEKLMLICVKDIIFLILILMELVVLMLIHLQ